MSGRAGRRGIDSTGMVLILCWNELPEASALSTMIIGKPTKLTSQFRLTYNMILNLFRLSGDFKVEDMMRRSFSEAAGQKLLDAERTAYKQAERSLQDIEDIVCHRDRTAARPPIVEYYETRAALLDASYRMRDLLARSGLLAAFLAPGRLIMVAYVRPFFSSLYLLILFFSLVFSI